ncbi:hypothetical protein A2774_02755 [Candidatus Roizmanbacteria bacterium RIFCSPHIGHO2_01_FULL_39_12c]|uniref:ATP-grasp domain-containing protein n=1 Tax=Candidatus Roizmanbacteria bacterium RIFCSPHIGHO2_01_FULL_39_12c TaxID=1802031 RepID=A0A1F7GBN6_9BACT|nr:MAG: hypothetical protein A2774_02755 [Candidatus Roizmanbacteria bacterium RIFCSPHIGHO2_01_FULL_39_12c]OGK47491.1 MAG: hypothetical protein A2963_01195 [Candidatus Roizmanbacteria bacterium RIFCSPLOWO2_01_FULL_40_13]
MVKRKNLALIYNLRRHYPDPKDPRSNLEADFDDPPTIGWMIKHLKKIGYNVIPIEADEKAYLKIYRHRKSIDLAFDFSFGLWGENKYGHIPGMLEMLRIPFATSSSFTRNLTLNKVKMKQILAANNIPTLPFQVFKNKSDVKIKKLPYPLIVKPIAQGSSAGITNKSIVKRDKELERQINFINTIFNTPAFVEPFLDFREFSVPLLGNPPRILPIIEPDFSLLPKKYRHIDSLEVKWIFEEQEETNYLVCPAKLSGTIKNKIEKVALATWDALEINDICRIDMRTDRNENLYVLDVNAPPGLIPPEVSMTSYFPLAARAAGIEYEELLKIILNSAIKRYRL